MKQVSKDLQKYDVLCKQYYPIFPVHLVKGFICPQYAYNTILWKKKITVYLSHCEQCDEHLLHHHLADMPCKQQNILNILT